MSEEEQKEDTPVEEKPQEKVEEVASVEEKPQEKAEKKEETAADLLGANIEQVKVRKAKGSKNISSGICFIVATFNNTKVSFSDMKGNVICPARENAILEAQENPLPMRRRSSHRMPDVWPCLTG